jgi:hypothetical protein
MIKIQYTKVIEEQVKPVLSLTVVNLLEPGERYGSLTIQYMSDGVEIDREEINYKKGDEFENFYAEWVDTQYLVDEVNINTLLAIEIPKVEDPVL